MTCTGTNLPFQVGFQHTHSTNTAYYVILLRIACHSALRPVGQEPEPSQATDMALASCFLGKVLGVGCHYFPPAFRHSNLRSQVPPRLHDARDPTSTPFWDILHTAKYDMGPTALLPLRRKAYWGFIRHKNPCKLGYQRPARLPLDHRSRSYRASNRK